MQLRCNIAFNFKNECEANTVGSAECTKEQLVTSCHSFFENRRKLSRWSGRVEKEVEEM